MLKRLKHERRNDRLPKTGQLRRCWRDPCAAAVIIRAHGKAGKTWAKMCACVLFGFWCKANKSRHKSEQIRSRRFDPIRESPISTFSSFRFHPAPKVHLLKTRNPSTIIVIRIAKTTIIATISFSFRSQKTNKQPYIL